MKVPSTEQTELDESFVNRAAPPGSMRYFSLLYAPEDKRDALLALYVVDAEVRGSAASPNHEVAHTRLSWWREEIERLVNGAPLHPATRLLHERAQHPPAGFAKLAELVSAAEMDLARMTYANVRELRAYCARSGGAVTEMIAMTLLAPAPLADYERAFANRIGVGLRQAEMLRDLRQDAYNGLIYMPLDELDAHGLTEVELRAAQPAPALRAALRAWRERIEADLASDAPPTDARFRPLRVLAALHRRLLDRIAARDYDVASRRIELGPIEKPWVAWRAARKSGR